MTDGKEDEIVAKRRIARAQLEQEEAQFARKELEKANALKDRAGRSLSKGKN